VLSRPSADSFAVGRRQKHLLINLNFCNLLSHRISCAARRRLNEKRGPVVGDELAGGRGAAVGDGRGGEHGGRHDRLRS
jgi:hypothetical protein